MMLTSPLGNTFLSRVLIAIGWFLLQHLPSTLIDFLSSSLLLLLLLSFAGMHRDHALNGASCSLNSAQMW